MKRGYLQGGIFVHIYYGQRETGLKKAGLEKQRSFKRGSLQGGATVLTNNGHHMITDFVMI